MLLDEDVIMWLKECVDNGTFRSIPEGANFAVRFLRHLAETMFHRPVRKKDINPVYIPFDWDKFVENMEKNIDLFTEEFREELNKEWLKVHWTGDENGNRKTGDREDNSGE